MKPRIAPAGAVTLCMSFLSAAVPAIAQDSYVHTVPGSLARGYVVSIGGSRSGDDRVIVTGTLLGGAIFVPVPPGNGRLVPSYYASQGSYSSGTYSVQRNGYVVSEYGGYTGYTGYTSYGAASAYQRGVADRLELQQRLVEQRAYICGYSGHCK
jgi:hypothetical protein